jgi:hypothetical protein
MSENNEGSIYQLLFLNLRKENGTKLESTVKPFSILLFSKEMYRRKQIILQTRNHR